MGESIMVGSYTFIITSPQMHERKFFLQSIFGKTIRCIDADLTVDVIPSSNGCLLPMGILKGV
jgi:hypothetical protein